MKPTRMKATSAESLIQAACEAESEDDAERLLQAACEAEED